MQEQWNNGLCREFASAICKIVESHKIGPDLYDLERIGQEVVALYQEMFAETGNIE